MFCESTFELADERAKIGIPAVRVDLNAIAANCLPRGKTRSHHGYSCRHFKFRAVWFGPLELELTRFSEVMRSGPARPERFWRRLSWKAVCRLSLVGF